MGVAVLEGAQTVRFRELEVEDSNAVAECQKCYILLPCYNEALNLKPLIKKLSDIFKDDDYEIVAVNDGSVDNTLDVLKKLSEQFPITIINHKSNLGLHMALKNGIKYIVNMSNSDDDIIITMDADNTHDPKYITQMIEKIRNGYDIVVASRYIDGGKQINVPAYRVFLSIGINTILRGISRVPVRDQTTGYRAYRVGILKNMINNLGDNFITSKGFEVAVELLIKSYRYGGRNVKVAEVPILLDYGEKIGKSKMRLFKTIFLYCYLVISLLFIKNI